MHSPLATFFHCPHRPTSLSGKIGTPTLPSSPIILSHSVTVKGRPEARTAMLLPANSFTLWTCCGTIKSKPRTILGAQSFEQIDPGIVGRARFHENTERHAHLRMRQQGGAVSEADDLVTALRKCLRQCLPHRRIIVDDEYFTLGRCIPRHSPYPGRKVFDRYRCEAMTAGSRPKQTGRLSLPRFRSPASRAPMHPYSGPVSILEVAVPFDRSGQKFYISGHSRTLA